MVVFACNPSTQKAETGGSGVPGQPGKHSKTLSPNTHTHKKQKRKSPRMSCLKTPAKERRAGFEIPMIHVQCPKPHLKGTLNNSSTGSSLSPFCRETQVITEVKLEDAQSHGRAGREPRGMKAFDLKRFCFSSIVSHTPSPLLLCLPP
jgi:hypothetical protein